MDILAKRLMKIAEEVVTDSIGHVSFERIGDLDEVEIRGLEKEVGKCSNWGYQCGVREDSYGNLELYIKQTSNHSTDLYNLSKWYHEELTTDQYYSNLFRSAEHIWKEIKSGISEFGFEPVGNGGVSKYDYAYVFWQGVEPDEKQVSEGRFHGWIIDYNPSAIDKICDDFSNMAYRNAAECLRKVAKAYGFKDHLI